MYGRYTPLGTATGCAFLFLGRLESAPLMLGSLRLALFLW